MIAKTQRAAWPALVLLAMTLAKGVTAAAEAAQSRDGGPRDAAAAAGGAAGGSVLNGYRRYHASCNHCHGPDGIGSSFGPGLIEAPLDAAGFRDAVLNGRASGSSVMKGFGGDPNVAPYVDDIYAYLRARTDGRLGRGRPPRKP